MTAAAPLKTSLGFMKPTLNFKSKMMLSKSLLAENERRIIWYVC